MPPPAAVHRTRSFMSDRGADGGTRSTEGRAPGRAGRELGHATGAAHAQGAWWRPATGPSVVVLAVLLANLPYLAGIVHASPIGSTDATSLRTVDGYLPGLAYLDPSVGWIFAPLAHLSAMDWVHGVVPWWNPYEGLGAPLAAGMQSASLFPPVLLFLLPNGIVWFHIALEVTAGLSTWLLVRELGLGRGVATFGGVLFALNGTFAWFAHAPSDPVPFLPLVLLGAERLWRRSSFDRGGWLAIAFGLALSIYGGFPETAYLQGLLVLAWCLLRLTLGPASGRLRYLLGTGSAAATGMLLSAPLAVPFLRNLPYADVGRHAGQIAVQPFYGSMIQMIGVPYLYGPIAAFNRAGHGHPSLRYFWGTASGGYLTSSAILLALIGALAGRSQRGLRRLLAVTALLALAWQLAVPPFASFFQAVVPLAHTVNAFRYISPVWELCVVLLACAGLDAIIHGSRHLGRAAAAAGAAVLALLATEVALGWHLVTTIARKTALYSPYEVGTIAWAAGVVVVVTAIVLVRNATGGGGGADGGGGAPRAPRAARRRRIAGGLAAVAALLAVVDAGAMFVLPELSAPRAAPIDEGPAHYLSSHLGYGRYFSMWAYHAEVGSYFQLASLNSNTMPVPKPWARYVDRKLASGADALIFDGSRMPPGGPTAAEELRRNLRNYEAAGVRYVLVFRDNHVFGHALSHRRYRHGIRRVYADSRFALYALPHPRPFFSTTGWPRDACRLRPSGISQVVATCSHPATLVRNELELPGWTASVNGKRARLLDVGGVTAVRLQAGRSMVSFSYLPPGFGLAMALFALGWVAVLGVATRHRFERLARGVLRRAAGRR